MRRSFDLQVTSFTVLIEFSSERALDVAGPRVVSFDKVAIIGVHDPHEVGKIDRGARIEGGTKGRRFTRQLSNNIRDRLGWHIKARRFDAQNAFDRRFFGRFLSWHNELIIKEKA
ncbi:MAG TPA: hypothetical protein VGJ68_16975 [Bradyrhizobium sp.]